MIMEKFTKVGRAWQAACTSCGGVHAIFAPAESDEKQKEMLYAALLRCDAESGTGNWDDLNKHVAALNEIMGAWGEVRRAQLEQALQAMGGRKVQ